MASAQATGALGGAAQGAAAGSIFGPWGTAIGAVAGGVMGTVMGGKAKKAKKYQQQAQAVQMQREQNAVNAQYIAMIREARTNRAGSLQASLTSGLSTSSLQTSALSSIGSQAQYNVQYLAEDRRLFQLYSNYMQRAGANLDSYQTLQSLLSASPNIAKGAGVIANSYDSREIQPFVYMNMPVLPSSSPVTNPTAGSNTAANVSNTQLKSTDNPVKQTTSL